MALYAINSQAFEKRHGLAIAKVSEIFLSFESDTTRYLSSLLTGCFITLTKVPLNFITVTDTRVNIF